VQGILTSKSLVTNNLGFAVEVNSLAKLLSNPRPIALSAWLTIGVLDPEEWQPKLGGGWRQRAGRILAEEPGSGFGGRCYCLSRKSVPEMPYEIAVTMKLDDESGAAGLIFHAEGEVHYGFYPSGGELRLTRFDGPDVYSWKILAQKKSPHYRPGEWNTLKVRIEKDRFRCYVNDQLVVESEDQGLTRGQAGLAKFRTTKAEFKHFEIAPKITSRTIPADLAARLRKEIAGPALPPGAAEKLAPDGALAMQFLRERAHELEQQAEQLRKLAGQVHQKKIEADLLKVLGGKETEIDLLHAALLLAKLDNDELDVELYRRDVERQAKALAASLPKDADDRVKRAALNKYLFTERGFRGSRADYYHRSNSYLNEVLDDREGLPITLSVVYLEFGRRLGLALEGVGLPGHFVVRFKPAKGEPEVIDVFDGGKVLSRDDVLKKVLDTTGQPLEERHLKAVTKRAIVVRMLHNLVTLAQRDRDGPALLRYLDVLVALQPDSAEERAMRAGARIQQGERKGALEDLDWLIQHEPPGIDLERVRAMRQALEKEEK
jgi:regulator of sirC expression with transglutaminase-like and TPR domain